MNKKSVTFYTDGSAKNNGTPNCLSGIGVYCLNTNYRYSGISEHAPHTSNRAEFAAIIHALEKGTSYMSYNEITIFSDSQYCINSVDGTWKLNKKKGKRKNLDLILMILGLMKKYTSVEYIWVRGHNGNEGNEIADGLANKAVYDNY